MLEQIIISGISGAFIILYVYGLAIIVKIFNDHRDNNKSWKDSFHNNVKNIQGWILFIFTSFLTLFIGFGLFVSIIWS